MTIHQYNKNSRYDIKTGTETYCGKATKGWTKVKQVRLSNSGVNCKDCLTNAGAVSDASNATSLLHGFWRMGYQDVPSLPIIETGRWDTGN